MNDQQPVRLSRSDPRLTLEQYQELMRRKKEANGDRMRYIDLMEQWNVGQAVLASAVYRGIKRYDYILLKGKQ